MLLSRVADALYWISRYLERAEHTVRVVDVRLELGIDREAPGEMMRRTIFDAANPDSVIACVIAARENARQVREEISSDMWQQINELFLRLREVQTAKMELTRPHYVARMVVEGAHLFHGITDETMGHGEGWRYLQAGRYLERASTSAALLDRHFDRQIGAEAASRSSSNLEWIALLRSCSALEAYCRRYTADIRPDRVAEFLLLDPQFPRSVRFAAARLESALRAIGGLTPRSAGGNRAERLAGRFHASLDYAQVDEFLNEDPHGTLVAVGRYCAQIHAALYQGYITYPIESALPA
jgi:uncharacterized alpha-E superfamily protein